MRPSFMRNVASDWTGAGVTRYEPSIPFAAILDGKQGNLSIVTIRKIYFFLVMQTMCMDTCWKSGMVAIRNDLGGEGFQVRRVECQARKYRYDDCGGPYCS